MDILSFVLGVSCVIFAGILACTVYLMLGVKKMNVDLNHKIEVLRDQLFNFNSPLEDLFNRTDDVNSRLDSRFDKCMTRIIELENNLNSK